MVDILKYPLKPPTSFPSNVFHFPSMTGTTILSPIQHHTPFDDRFSAFNLKRWVGRRPGDPPRLLDVAHAPYGIHRTIINRELSRPVPGRTDFLATFKHRDPHKIRNSAAPTPVVTQTSLLNIQTQQTRLLDSYSKHISVKGESLRPANHLTHGTASTLTAWQKYWTSTHAERRRKEAHESELIFYQPKQQTPPIPLQTHIVHLRDSPPPYEDSRSTCRTPLSPPSSCSPTKLSSVTSSEPLGVSPKESSPCDSHQASSYELSSSTFLPSLFDVNSSMTESKLSITIPLKFDEEEKEQEQQQQQQRDEEQGKLLTEKSFFFSDSSQFKSDSQLIDEVAGAQKQPAVPSKIYEFKVLMPKRKLKKRSQSKSNETQLPPPPRSLSKGNRQIAIKTNSIPTKKQTTFGLAPLKPKKESKKWDEPYVGNRLDPPTPPSSPSLSISPPPNGQYENDSPSEESQLFQFNSKDKNLFK